MTPEFSRPIHIDTLGSASHQIVLKADQKERRALARRFDLAGIAHLIADMALTRHGEEITAAGRLDAQITQICVVTGEPINTIVEEKFRISFRPQPANVAEADEIELDETEMDVIFYDGASIDLGEAVAETLALSLDPYPRSPSAEIFLRKAGIKSEEEAMAEETQSAAARNPFSILLKKE